MLSVACTGFWLLIVISGLKLKAYPEGRYMIMKNKMEAIEEIIGM